MVLKYHRGAPEFSVKLPGNAGTSEKHPKRWRQWCIPGEAWFRQAAVPLGAQEGSKGTEFTRESCLHPSFPSSDPVGDKWLPPPQMRGARSLRSWGCSPASVVAPTALPSAWPLTSGLKGSHCTGLRARDQAPSLSKLHVITGRDSYFSRPSCPVSQGHSRGEKERMAKTDLQQEPVTLTQ